MSDIHNNDIRRLDGGLLLVFRELCRVRRTTAVAARLGLSQSAVSQALARLRHVFRDPLFHRRPHGLEPTPRALELAPRVEALLDMMAASLKAGSAFAPADTTRVFNIGLTEYSAGVATDDLVRIFQARAPQASFRLQFVRGYVALSALQRGLLDAAIGRFDATAEGLRSEALLDDRYCCVARQGHPTIQGRLTPELWRATGHIFASASSILDEVFGPAVGEDAMPNIGDVARVAVVPRWEVAYAMVAGSDAIATGSRRLAERMAKPYGLQVIGLPQPSWTVSIARRDERDEGLDWLCDELRGSLSGEKAKPPPSAPV